MVLHLFMSGCTPQSNVFHQAFGPGINGLLWWLSDVGGSGFIPESWVPSLGREGWDDPLEKEMALEYSCLGNPLTEEPGGLQSMGSQRARHNLAHMQRGRSNPQSPNLHHFPAIHHIFSPEI